MTEGVELGTALIGARHLGDCYQAIERFLPGLVWYEHYDCLFANLKTGTGLRYKSKGFPVGVFCDSSIENLQVNPAVKYARSMKPGSYLHAASLRDGARAPAARDPWLQQISAGRKFYDALTVLLYFNRSRHWGAWLTLWREKTSPPFTPAEVSSLGLLGPLLAAGFTKAIEMELDDLNRKVQSQIFSITGRVAFVAWEDGTPLVQDRQVKCCLSQIFGVKVNGGRPPTSFRKIIRFLVRTLNRKKSPPKVAVKDVVCGNRICRVYLSRAEPTPDGTPTYKVLVDCDPETANLTVLKEIGLTEIQVKIVELLLRGGTLAGIAKALEVSKGDVNYHLPIIGEKLQADGKTEIATRAIAVHQELLLKSGLCSPQGA
ncbi:MAG: hypothetical protein PHR35_18205 [Kiritimatiellae bacterium]|nr:hypothetical protein [Kiritimatiellia bacterium]